MVEPQVNFEDEIDTMDFAIQRFRASVLIEKEEAEKRRKERIINLAHQKKKEDPKQKS